MKDYKDLSGITRSAGIAVWAFMAVNLLFGMGNFYELNLAAAPPAPDHVGPVEYLALLYLLILAATIILVGRWIYRASSNAHTLASDLTIAPGWAVGWFFVPFANLVRPFQAMKETWLASHYRTGHGRDAPTLLSVWWGLWLLNNVLGQASFRIKDAALAASFDLASGIFGVPLCVALVMIFRRVTAAQRQAAGEAAFA
ncbi:DUF4328 domain-containing protein [Sphingomonas crusticola]|uniref:DUF4328 domain-containing protein n=1 Tax=Sphingomonas crusticola TaxID=1697973 RepID=UPI000E26A23D|nr:DUF4328 domain-containing protein [Sphingomonas crusticola]